MTALTAAHSAEEDQTLKAFDLAWRNRDNRRATSLLFSLLEHGSLPASLDKSAVALAARHLVEQGQVEDFSKLQVLVRDTPDLHGQLASGLRRGIGTLVEQGDAAALTSWNTVIGDDQVLAAAHLAGVAQGAHYLSTHAPDKLKSMAIAGKPPFSTGIAKGAEQGAFFMVSQGEAPRFYALQTIANYYPGLHAAVTQGVDRAMADLLNRPQDRPEILTAFAAEAPTPTRLHALIRSAQKSGWSFLALPQQTTRYCWDLAAIFTAASSPHAWDTRTDVRLELGPYRGKRSMTVSEFADYVRSQPSPSRQILTDKIVSPLQKMFGKAAAGNADHDAFTRSAAFRALTEMSFQPPTHQHPLKLLVSAPAVARPETLGIE